VKNPPKLLVTVLDLWEDGHECYLSWQEEVHLRTVQKKRPNAVEEIQMPDVEADVILVCKLLWERVKKPTSRHSPYCAQIQISMTIQETIQKSFKQTQKRNS
jgi:hypothetical protein